MLASRLRTALTAALAATCLVSLFAAQILLALAAVGWLIGLASRRIRLERIPLDGPILAFSVWTLLAASFSADPLTSYYNAKKLALFAVVPIAVEVFSREQERERILDALLLGGVVLALGALSQYYFLGFDDINRRPRSFLGHYMTASGLYMGTLMVAAARLAFRGGPWSLPSKADIGRLLGLIAALGTLTLLKTFDVLAVEGERGLVAGLALSAMAIALSRSDWPTPATGTHLAALALTLSAWALLVSQTRNAWLGAMVGLCVVVLLRAPRMLFLVPLALGALLVVKPGPVARRLTITDPASVDRYYMWQAGIDMVLDKPIFGQGPGMMLEVYPKFRWPQAPNPRTPHLHDNALHLAAERGLPCLAWWLWMMAAALGDAYREVRRGVSGAGWVAGAALAAITAVMTAGLFEYNFGDSEVLIFTLLVAALPYGLRRQRALSAAPAV